MNEKRYFTFFPHKCLKSSVYFQVASHLILDYAYLKSSKAMCKAVVQG